MSPNPASPELPKDGEALPPTTPYDPEDGPYVGCAATVHVGSDSYPATVVQLDGNYLTIALDHSILTGGHWQSEHQEYLYTYDAKAPWREYRWNDKRQAYYPVGGRYHGQSPLGLGYRRAYRDPCF